MGLTFAEAIKRTRTELNVLTGLDISSTLGAEPDDDGWRVTLEAVEKRAIPDSMDILAIYEMRLDHEGNVLEFNRVGMRKRIDTIEM